MGSVERSPEADPSPEVLPAPVAAAFGAEVRGAEPLGRGLIHRTWAAPAAQARHALVIQRLNTEIFRDPVRLMENVVRTTEHLRAQLQREGMPEPERRCLRVVPTLDGESLFRDAAGGTWRAFERIADAVPCPVLEGPGQAEDAARTFGDFARRLADLPPPALHETLPRFHDFAARIETLERAARADACGRAGAVGDELDALRVRCQAVQQRLAAVGFASLPRRVVHHDCKLDNLLFDAAGGGALCVVDLDTVMPGTLLSDFGELVRSSTHTGAGHGADPARVGFAEDLYHALARGYREGVGELLSPAERRALPFAGPLLTLMNAVRFLSDHLEGDVYFRISEPGQNLVRARIHLQLATRMLEREEVLQAPFAGSNTGAAR